MGFTSVLAQAQKIVGSQLRPGEIAVDATVGTGVDTAFLAEKIGSKGRVYGFDVQPEALNQAERRLIDAGLADRVTWLLQSHAEMAQHLPPAAKGQLGAVMFNLGYLPGSDQQVITTSASTIQALDIALEWIRPGGVITVVAYPGHPGGDEEADAVRRWAADLPAAAYQALCYEFINQSGKRPFLLAVTKNHHRTSSA